MRNYPAKIGAVTLGGVLPLLLAIGGTAQAATATSGSHPVAAHGVTRTASPDSTGFCNDPTLGGTFYCTDGDYSTGEAWWTFPNGTVEVFVVGTNRSVYTRWTIDGVGWSSGWTNMGGQSASFPPLFYEGGSLHQTSGGSYTPNLEVAGLNGGNPYHRQRQTNGTWTGWAPGY